MRAARGLNPATASTVAQGYRLTRHAEFGGPAILLGTNAGNAS